MKPIYIVILVIVIAATAFYGVMAYQKNQQQASSEESQQSASSRVGASGGQSDRSGNHEEGEMPKTGNPCGGTEGLGQIVSVGKDSIIIKLNHDTPQVKKGSTQIVNLTSQTTVRTSAGVVSVSDLKTGDKVVLVGGPNPDGSFTADTVAVCGIISPTVQPEQ
jgi:hypothetical protein